jgi:hypothetical protein
VFIFISHDIDHRGNWGHCASVGFYGATAEVVLAPSFEIENSFRIFVCDYCFQRMLAAVLDLALSAAIILPTAGSELAMPCCCAIQVGQLCRQRVVAAVSAQTGAFDDGP